MGQEGRKRGESWGHPSVGSSLREEEVPVEGESRQGVLISTIYRQHRTLTPSL